MADVLAGKADTGVHGVTFRIEIEQMRHQILNHVMDHEDQLADAISHAVREGLNGIDRHVREAVDVEIPRVINRMVAERVGELMYSNEFGDAVRELIASRLQGAFTK